MPAYVVVEIDVHDPERYEEYKTGAKPLVEQHGGRFLARGGRVEVLEGAAPASRVVVIEFPSMEQAHAWWSSDAYTRVRAIRQATATSRMYAVDGV